MRAIIGDCGDNKEIWVGDNRGISGAAGLCPSHHPT